MATTEELKVDEADDREEEQEEEEEESNGESKKPLEAHSPSAPKAFSRSPAAGLKNIGTISLRELRAYFDSLIAYVVVGGSLLGLGVYFFLFQSGGFWQVDRATMSRMFEFMPWALSVLVIPLVTMRALAEEKRSGT